MSSLFLRRAALAPRAAVRAFGTSSPRSVARITIIGNIADTPEAHPTSTGKEVLRYAVASNSGPRDNRHTSWFRVSSFISEDSKKKEFMLGIPKGSLVYVDGDASISSYVDAEGKNRTSLNVVQRSIEVLKRPQTESTEQ